VRWRLAATCLLCSWISAAIVSAAPAPRRSTPVVRWQLALPGWGEPAADDSVAYFLTRAHEVVSVDAARGSIRWRSHTGGAGEVPTGTQVRLTSGRVLVGDGGIVALDRTSGRRLWRFDAPDSDDATSSTLSSFVVPEPGTFALLGIALIGVGFTFRKKSA